MRKASQIAKQIFVILLLVTAWLPNHAQRVQADGAVCTIFVNSIVDGVNVSPPGGYTYALSGPGFFTGGGTTSYPNQPIGNWTIVYTGGATVTFTGYTPSQSQSCDVGGSVTFTLNFSSGAPISAPPGPGGTGSPLNANSATDSNVECGTIQLSWGNVPGATNYNLYRSTDPANPGAIFQVINSGNGSYTDLTVTSAITYYYWIQTHTAKGDSGLEQFSPFGIQSTDCNADFSSSNYVLTAVNGQPFSYASSCVITTQTGTVKTIKQGDVLSVSIDLCNNGTLDAVNPSVIVDLTGTDLTWGSPMNLQMNGTGHQSSINGNVGTFSFNRIPQGFNARIKFDLIAVPSGTQKLQRFFSNAKLTYTTGLSSNNKGCKSTGTNSNNPCVLSTGYFVFYNGARIPSRQEVTP